MSEFTTTVNGHLSIVGRINTKSNLRGNVVRDDNLRGNISTQGNMVGMMFAELYMNGLLNNPCCDYWLTKQDIYQREWCVGRIHKRI